MIDQERLQLTRNAMESYLQGNFEPVFELMSDDVTVRLTVGEETPLSGVFRGKAGVQEYFGRNAQTVETSSMEVLNYLAGGGQVAIIGRETLTVNQSGRVMKDADWVMVCTFRDDKICEIVVVEDTTEIANAYQRLAVSA